MRNIHSTPWMAVNQADEKTVEIDITGIIGGSIWDLFDENSDESKNTREKMKAELKALSEIKAQKIIVNIDSPGGDVAHGLSIHDMLVQHSAEIETRIYGLTASIATIIAMAGDKRVISDNALMLIHRASYAVWGSFNQTELKSAVEDLNKFDERIINIYNKRSEKKEDISSLMDANNGNGKWIDGAEAKELGLIDDVFQPVRAAAVYDEKLFNKLKYPKIENMTKKAEDTRSLFDKMKEAFNAVFQVADKEAEVPQDVKDRLAEFDGKLKELEGENTSLSTELEVAKNDMSAKDLKIQELTTAADAQKAELDKKVREASDLVNELSTLKNKWEPAGRSKTEGGKNKVDGVDLDRVKEIIAKQKDK